MEKPREYRADEEIQAGDVVCSKDNPYAFNTCIVVYTEEKTRPPRFGVRAGDTAPLHKETYVLVHLERAHMVVTASGTAFVSTERFNVEEARFRGEYRVWTTGASGNKDNRSVKKHYAY